MNRTQTCRNLLSLWLVLVAAAALAAPAEASLLRNAVSRVGAGQTGVGFGLSDDGETFFADIGLSRDGTLEASLGNVDLPGDDGLAIGVGYRLRLGTPFELSERPVRTAALAIVRYGDADLGSVSGHFVQLDLGLGGSLSLAEGVRAFASPILRHVTADAGDASDSDTDVGLVLGADFGPEKTWNVGFALHLGLKDDYSLYGALRF